MRICFVCVAQRGLQTKFHCATSCWKDKEISLIPLWSMDVLDYIYDNLLIVYSYGI